jgi:hypothetical protein
MADPEKLTRLINRKVNVLRKAQRGQPQAPPPAAASAVQELAELARLRASGDISDEDYARMKARIVGEGPSSGDTGVAAKPKLVDERDRFVS